MFFKVCVNPSTISQVKTLRVSQVFCTAGGYASTIRCVYLYRSGIIERTLLGARGMFLLVDSKRHCAPWIEGVKLQVLALALQRHQRG
ncbi:hypothetical protein BG74_04165 [Sodalis-like endosymbiont of Proechinophthirus fluctus]|nr:hypothetical protein BG74_04165 [Sodalis-like endosymbiont of Proechinophthirus fluctus]